MPLVAPYDALAPILREFTALDHIRRRRGGLSAENQARISADLDLFETGRGLIERQSAHTDAFRSAVEIPAPNLAVRPSEQE